MCLLCIILWAYLIGSVGLHASYFVGHEHCASCLLLTVLLASCTRIWCLLYVLYCGVTAVLLVQNRHGGNYSVQADQQIRRLPEKAKHFSCCQKAYGAADEAAIAANLAGALQYLVAPVSQPSVGRKKEYQVRTQPCGYNTSVSTEQVNSSCAS